MVKWTDKCWKRWKRCDERYEADFIEKLLGAERVKMVCRVVVMTKLVYLAKLIGLFNMARVAHCKVTNVREAIF